MEPATADRKLRVAESAGVPALDATADLDGSSGRREHSGIAERERG
jgi:hypothetical protein